jgi:hypothetical protein
MTWRQLPARPAALLSFLGDRIMRLRQSVGFASALLVALTLAGASHADGVGARAKDALDPDCTVTKAVRGTATKAVVGVRGNRCDAGETMRDTLGIDDRDHGQKDADGPLKKLRKD